MSIKKTCCIIVLGLVSLLNSYAQKTAKGTATLKYNGIYQTEKDGKQFVLKNDSTKVVRVGTTGFVGVNNFKNVKTSFDYNGLPTLNIELDDLGKEIFLTLTEKNIGKPLAFIFNNTLYSAPVVNAKIPNGRLAISGFDSVKDTEKLKRLIEVLKLRTAKDKLD